MKLAQFIFLIFIIYSIPLSAQKEKSNPALTNGEELYYKAYYKLGFIWIYSGNVHFSTNNIKYQDKDVYQFISTGRSLAKYDWLYKVNDRFESLAEKSSYQPFLFERNTHERNNFTHNRYLFDYSAKKIYTETENENQSKTIDTIDFVEGTMDVLSAIYYCRNLDYADMEPDEKIPLKMVINNQIYELFIHYLGIENIKNREKQEYSCYKFSIRLVEGTMFKGGEELVVWLSKDDLRRPLVVSSKVMIGSVNAYLWQEE
ncbi:MAG: DUF3108 domain-containing protein [Bacteroidota bacterium]|nr:DUF3108 domain-containing protein [Bacteroidota bacterium]